MSTGLYSIFLGCLATAFLDMTLSITIFYLFVVCCSPTKPIALSAIILGLVMVGRAAFVFPLSFLSNLSKKEARPKISFRQQVVLEFFLLPLHFTLSKQRELIVHGNVFR